MHANATAWLPNAAAMRRRLTAAKRRRFAWANFSATIQQAGWIVCQVRMAHPRDEFRASLSGWRRYSRNRPDIHPHGPRCQEAGGEFRDGGAGGHDIVHNGEVTSK